MEKVADKFCVRDLVSSLWTAGYGKELLPLHLLKKYQVDS